MSKLRVTPAVVHVARLPGRLRRPVRTTVRYMLSEPARVRIVLQRPRDGRRAGGTCRAPSPALARAPHCTRYVALTQVGQRAVAGANAKKVTGRAGNWPLPPGRYRFAVTATDAAGNRSKLRTTAFRVLARCDTAAPGAGAV